MAKMALMPYSGATSLFLRVFFDKRYQLPLGCIDAIVQHFGSQLQHNPSSTYQLPVLWHQCLLTFLQRYKNELTPDQIYLINKVCPVYLLLCPKFLFALISFTSFLCVVPPAPCPTNTSIRTVFFWDLINWVLD